MGNRENLPFRRYVFLKVTPEKHVYQENPGGWSGNRVFLGGGKKAEKEGVLVAEKGVWVMLFP